jgi:hypothetical protein
MPLSGTESALGDALYNAATASEGDAKQAWQKVATAIIDHITKNSLVTGTCPPNGGPLTLGKVT